MLDFEDDGRPLHPLVSKLKSIEGKKGKGVLPRWGANFTTEALVISSDGTILANASSFLKQGEDPQEAALKALRKMNSKLAISLRNKPCKIVYANMDNFDSRNTENAWVETTICMWKVNHPIDVVKSEYTRNPLHQIIIGHQ